MDFFEAQDNALARTKWLVFYFFAAVVLIIVAVYLAVTAGVFYYHHKAGLSEAPQLISFLRIILTSSVVIPMICMGSFWKISQLRSKGGGGVAEALGGRKITSSTKRANERKLRNVVEEMAIASGLPVPEVYILDRESGINAFAAGFSFNDAAVGITRGALEQFDRDELQGVVAHEFSHILNGDMQLNTRLSGWIHGIIMLTLLGRGFWRLIGGGDSDNDGGGGIYIGGGRSRGGGGGGSDSKGGGAGALILAIILVAVLITIIGFIGEFFARLIQASVSRQREFLADASAVQFTRNPEGIGNALRRIGGFHRHAIVGHPNTSEFAHSFFSSSLKSGVSIWATHPPLDQRISKIVKDWKGDFLKPRPRPKPETPRKKETQQRSPFGGIAGRNAGENSDFQKMLTAGLFMRCLGELKTNSQAYAQKIHAKLQVNWPEAFEDAEASPALLLSLLHHTDGASAAKQLEVLESSYPDFSESITHFAKKLKELDRSERLIMIGILADRLPEALIESERREFIECVEAFVAADEKVTPFEIACLQTVRRSLLKESDFAPKRHANDAIVEAASILATRLLAETRIEGLSANDILESASKQAPYFMNLLGTAESVDPASIAKAFDTLASSHFGIRKQFLAICERIVAADKKASIEEVELLRAIAIGIAVPAAPILPEIEDEYQSLTLSDNTKTHFPDRSPDNTVR